MNGRWDRLLDSRKVALVDQLMTEAAAVAVQDLLGPYPPPVQDVDPRTAGELVTVMREGRPRPPLAAFLEAIRLARFDLEREFEAYDEYVRNFRWREHGLADEHRADLLFLCRWLTEMLFQLVDATDGRVKRRDLLACLDQIERRCRPPEG